MAIYYSHFALKFEPASPEQGAFIQEAFDKASEDDTLVAWLHEASAPTTRPRASRPRASA